MSALQTWCSHWNVALLVEGVDRNVIQGTAGMSPDEVALLAEGVDRNAMAETGAEGAAKVALLAEGVDRNMKSSKP